MMNDTQIWLERLNSLYKSQMRQAASKADIPLVHLEILQYLSICNHYSNTAQALSEYLGQTKGSISQSLKVMEKIGYVTREASIEDKRVAKLYLTKEGKQCLREISGSSEFDYKDDGGVIEAIQSLLVNWQDKHKQQGFGQCQSCKYNQNTKENGFLCGLTNESLTTLDIRKICREHEFELPNLK